MLSQNITPSPRFWIGRTYLRQVIHGSSVGLNLAIAIRKWKALNPDRLQYQMIFIATDTVTADQLRETRAFVEGAETQRL